MRNVLIFFLFLLPLAAVSQDGFDMAKLVDTIVKYRDASDYEMCTKVFQTHLKRADQYSPKSKGQLFYYYSKFLKHVGKYDQSLLYLTKAQLIPHDPNEAEFFDKTEQLIYRQKAYIYFDTHEMDSSRRYLNLLLEDHSFIADRTMSFVRNIQGYFEFLDGNYAEAEKIYLSGIEYQRTHEDTYCGLPLTTVKLMQLYGKTGELDKLKAIFDETIAVCKKCNSQQDESYARYVMAELSDDNQDYKTAFAQYKIARTMDDSLKEVKNHEALADLDKKYQSDLKDETIRSQKEKERASQIAQVEKDKLTNTIFIGLVVVITIIIFFLWRNSRQRIVLRQQKVEIERNLNEKQLLLKEIHHRVKNNFQIVSSLLELQAKGIEDEKALQLALEGQNRVKSMAFIHQKLYQNDDFLISFDDFTEKLIKEIGSMYAIKDVVLDLQISKETLFDVDTAIPLGLMINELITNAFKYGFQKGRENKLLVRIEDLGEKNILVVQDNGPGIPEGINIAKSKSLGMRLVRRLSKQLGGEMHYSFQNGAEFRVVFRDTQSRMEED